MREFLKRLERDGELLVVHREVDPRHELAAVTDRVQRTVNKPLLFQTVKGTSMPVATNLYGSRERLAAILNIDADDFCRRWNDLLGAGAGPSEFVVEVAERPAFEEGVLSDLPLITYCERDAAPYITSAIYLAREPELGVHNLSFHRSMYVSDDELRVRLAPRHDLTRYHERAERAGRPLEAALLVGPPPEVFLAAAARLPYESDELQVAARLMGRPVSVRRCRFIDLLVPADTEIVIEGRFLPNERRPEGPFGEFMGYYVPEGPNAVFEVLGVSWRPGAIFHSILCGSPEEVLSLELAVAANVYHRVSAVLPGVVDVNCLPFALHTVIKLRAEYPGHARQILMAAFGADPTWCKVCTVVDDDVNIYDLNDVMWAILTRSRPDRSVLVLPEIPSFYRDPHHDHWGRLGIDATAPFERRHEFTRKRIPGVETLDLGHYLPDPR